MPKSEINKLSKRQILESLYYEQNQSTTTLSRFVTTVARMQNIDPVELAKAFNDDALNQDYIKRFNDALRLLNTPPAAGETAAAEPSPNGGL
jgi:hypothetical protein